MKKTIYILLILLFLVGLANANLGDFKQNDCVKIVVPLNATNVTLTNVNSPSPNSTILLTNKAMTGSNNFFNYTFCNTSQLGLYTYGYCDQDGNCYGNSFNVNGSGQNVTTAQIILLVIGVLVLLIFAGFFFLLSLFFRHPGPKIFLISLCALTLIVIVGLIVSNAAIYLAEFGGVVTIYNSYYIIMITFAGVGVIGLLVWLIYYSFTLFSKTRGVYNEED